MKKAGPWKAGIIPLLSLLFLAVLSSCQENPVEQYGEKTVKTYKETQKFGNTTTVYNLRQAINGFQAAEGRYPRDLRELSDFTGIPLSEEDYDYDPATGTISQKEQ